MKYCVEVKIPPYTVGQAGGIRIWIRQVDIRMELMDITTEKERYQHLVVGLPLEIIGRVYDLILEQPETEQYSTLMKRIENEFEALEYEHIVKLVKGMKCGTKKPSLHLREMRALAENRLNEKDLRETFLTQMPPRIAALGEDLDWDLDVLALVADGLCSREEMEAVNYAQSNDTKSNENTEEQQIERLIRAFDRWCVVDGRGESITRRNRSRQRAGTPHPRSRSRRNRSRKRNPKSELCDGHNWYGDKARTKEKWCE